MLFFQHGRAADRTVAADVAASVSATLDCNCGDPDWQCGCVAPPGPTSNYCDPVNKRRWCWIVTLPPGMCCSEGIHRLESLDAGAAGAVTAYLSPFELDPCTCNPNWIEYYNNGWP